MLCPTQGSREATPSGNKEAPSDVAAHYTQEDVKGGKNRRKQNLQGTTTMSSCDDGHEWEAGDSGVRCISTPARTDKRPARPPTDHFKRLLKEASKTTHTPSGTSSRTAA
jgi:hypothetical protein